MLSFWVVICGATGVLESNVGTEVMGLGMPMLAGANLGAGGRIGSCGVEGLAHLSICGCSNLIPSLFNFSAT